MGKVEKVVADRPHDDLRMRKVPYEPLTLFAVDGSRVKARRAQLPAS